MRLLMLGLAAASALTGTRALAAPAAAPQAAPTATTAACAPSLGLPKEARCGTVLVPEDRTRPGGRKLALRYAVVPGEAPRAEDPIVFLAGGPGQGGVQVGPTIVAELRRVDRTRDIVLVDQRGTGGSNPLHCPQGFELLARGGDAEIRRCAAALAEKADLRRYGTDDAVEDLEDLRRALGYERINLGAASYGVRPALSYMRRRPERVRSALLRAAAPPDFNIIGEGLGNAGRELERVIADCQADPSCRVAYPELRRQLQDLERRLQAAPEVVPAPGGEVRVTPELLQQVLYALMLSAPSRQQIPFVISTAATKGFAPIAPMLASVRDALYGALPVGMYLSVVCTEDAPRLDAGPVQPSGFDSMGPRLAEACRSWPAGTPSRDLFRPLRSTTPTLVLSGEADPATTPASADRLVRTLRNAAHIRMPGVAHGPMIPECVQAAAGRFIAQASVSGLQDTCRSGTLPPFFVPPQGAPAAAK